MKKITYKQLEIYKRMARAEDRGEIVYNELAPAVYIALSYAMQPVERHPGESRASIIARAQKLYDDTILHSIRSLDD